MYVDSAILIKLVVREPDSEYYADLTDGQTSICSSELAMTECRSALSRKYMGGEFDKHIHGKAWEKLTALWSDHGGLTLIPVSRIILKEAGEIIHRLAISTPLRTLDAIHLATCQQLRPQTLITNDRVMREAAKKLKIPLNALPNDQ